MKILPTGATSFIGSHASRLLLGRVDTVLGLDNLSAYYESSSSAIGWRV